MPENPSTSLQTAEQTEDEISFMDLFITLAKHKKKILGITLIVALVAAGVALRMPNIYTATSKILSPQSGQSSSINALVQSQLGGSAGGLGGLLGFKDPNAVYIALLKSRNIAEKIVHRFDLQKIYNEETMSAAIKALENSSVIVSGKDGVISVSVSDVEPQRAADLANAYFEELEKLTQTIAISEVSKRRLFLEKQLGSAKDRLADAEKILDKTPNTSLKYMDALRNLKYQEALYEMLAKQYEMAKLDEAREAPLLQVLDKAQKPENKVTPNRKNIVVLSTLGGALFAIVLTFILEITSRLRGNPEYEKRRALLKSHLSWSKKHASNR